VNQCMARIAPDGQCPSFHLVVSQTVPGGASESWTIWGNNLSDGEGSKGFFENRITFAPCVDEFTATG
jgi:hypothetical protein